MKLCPDCQHCYEDTDDTCAQEGHGGLVTARAGGRLIAGKYRLDKLIARGGMGAVYIGTHVDLNRPVAIKLLLPNYNPDEQAFERFRREAYTASSVTHPNIVHIYDFGVLPEGEAYIIMEFANGVTLRDRLREEGQLPIPEAVSIVRQIAAGMDAAHNSGVIHRDLKPSNIILTRDHSGNLLIKIIDFGIAKMSEQLSAGDATLTITGTIVGTPRYMSPEQCGGEKVDARSDIYSLGIILYEMLAGRPPFEGDSAVALAVKHLKEPPPPIEEFRSDIDPLLKSLVEDCLSTNPDERPQTASELASRLDMIMEADHKGAVRDQVSSALPGDQKINSAQPLSPAPSIPSNSVAAVPVAVESIGDMPIADRPVEAAPIVAEMDADKRRFGPRHIVVNLDEKPPEARRSRPMAIYAALAAVLTVAALAYWGATRRQTPVQAESTAAATSAATSPLQGAVPSPTATPQPSAKRTASASPTPAQDESTAKEAKPAEPEDEATQADRAEVTGAVEEWIEATNARDVGGQMSMYNSNLSAFYKKRNVSRDAVKAEKQRVIGAANKVEVATDEPEVNFSRDGRTATTRFRKRYVIEGDEKSREGEVLQELRWVRTPAGWKIVSERDLRVIR
jgi:serine/threonine-protein kinase